MEQVGKSALHAFSRHHWYLTSEMVPLALFSELVPEQYRHDLATRLLQLRPENMLTAPAERFGTGYGKPKFPANISLDTTLADLAGPDSWFIFCALKLDPVFLQLEVASWPSSPAY